MTARDYLGRARTLILAPARLAAGRRRSKRQVAAGTSLTLIAQAVMVTAGAAAVGGCGGAAACTPTPPDFTPSGHQESTAQTTVTLPTGEQIEVSGQTLAPLLPSARPGQPTAAPSFARFGVAGDQYMIPAEAVPYLGTVLDPRLFDVSYLARAARADHGSVPLTVSYTGHAAPALPGMRVTRASAGTATAVADPAQPSGLAGLLTSRWKAGQASIPGITRISLAQPSGGPALPAPPVLPAAASSAGQHRPQYHTLTVKFTGTSADASEVGMLQNVDDARLGTYLVLPSYGFSTPGGTATTLHGQQGPLSFSVPDGTYSLLFTVMTPHPGTRVGVDSALLSAPQVTVNGDQTVTLDATTAKPYSVSLSTPVTVSARADEINVFRSSLAGGGCGGALPAVAMGLYSESGKGTIDSTLAAAPTTPVTKGAFYFDANSTLYTGPNAMPLSGPRYDLDFPQSGTVPASLSYTVAAKDLTTVHSKIYASDLDPSTTPQVLGTTVYHPWLDFMDLGGDLLGCTPPQETHACLTPGDRTDYRYSSDPSLSIWQNTLISFVAGAGNRISRGTEQIDRPGQQVTEVWNKGPDVPSAEPYNLAQGAVNVTTLSHALRAAPLLTTPAATRQGDNGVLYVRLSDSDPAHQAAGELPYAEPAGGNLDTIAFYRDGKLATPPLSQDADGYYLPLLPHAATYRLDYRLPGNNVGAVGASLDTDWTFRSAPSDPAAKLPDTEICPIDASRDCSLLPLLFVTYDLPLNYDDQVPAGQPATIGFTIAGQPGQAPPSGVSATMSASFDDGKTWSPVTAKPAGNGTFTATIDTPALSATSGFVSLRVNAKDGKGNSVDQTIIRAYGLAG